LLRALGALLFPVVFADPVDCFAAVTAFANIGFAVPFDIAADRFVTVSKAQNWCKKRHGEIPNNCTDVAADWWFVRPTGIPMKLFSSYL
jgi:hypothetical protein